MSRRARLHVPGGTYYLLQLGPAHRAIFMTSADYARFSRVLLSATRRHHVQVIAYCWLASSIHFAVRIRDQPLSRFVQTITSQYARYRNRECDLTGHFFAERHRALLVDPQSWLASLIRYLHYLPVLEHITDTPTDYAYSSHRTYLGRHAPAWLDTHAGLRAIASLPEAPTYARFMASAPPPQEIEGLTHGNREDPRVLAPPSYVATLPRSARPLRSSVSLASLLHAVSVSLDLDPSAILSRSRRRELALARSLIAWHAIERNVASLTEVARYLHRDPSTLSAGIERHRHQRPELFHLDAMRYLTPLA